MTTIQRKQLRSQSGIALLTTILLMLLMASMLVGFIILINSGQQVSGMNNDYSKAFYAAEAGMEQLTAGLGTLFDSTYSPSGDQIRAVPRDDRACDVLHVERHSSHGRRLGG